MSPAFGMPYMPWALKYAWNAAISSSVRPLRAEVLDGHVVDREETHGRAVFRRHVRDRCPVRHAERAAPLPKNSTKAPTTFSFRSISVIVSTRSVAVTPSVELTREVHADDIGGKEIEGLAEHAGLCLDPAHAPADNADAVDHGGVAVGADEGIGIIEAILAVHAARRDIPD